MAKKKAKPKRAPLKPKHVYTADQLAQVARFTREHFRFLRYEAQYQAKNLEHLGNLTALLVEHCKAVAEREGA